MEQGAGGGPGTPGEGVVEETEDAVGDLVQRLLNGREVVHEGGVRAVEPHHADLGPGFAAGGQQLVMEPEREDVQGAHDGVRRSEEHTSELQSH